MEMAGIVASVRISNRPGDTGKADPAVTAALEAYGTGTGGEHDALTAVANSRLLVPVVSMLSESGDSARPAGGSGGASHHGTEKETEMALPTLVGRDGRPAVIAFTGTATIRRWNPEARPVPFPAARVWEYTTQEGSAVVIDVAGPVPLVVEGARLAALAAGGQPPLPHEDPDVRAMIAAVTDEFDLEPGPPGTDFLLALRTSDANAMREISARVRATGRFRRGMAVRLLSRTARGVSHPPIFPRMEGREPGGLVRDKGSWCRGPAASETIR